LYAGRNILTNSSPNPTYNSDSVFFWFSVGCFFCDFESFFGLFSGDFRFSCRHPHTLWSINIHIHISQLFSQCWQVGFFHLRFPPWLTRLVTPPVYSLISLNNFLLNYTKNTYNQRGIQHATFTRFTKYGS